MKHVFPHITDLRDVEKALKGREDFVIAEREFGYVANYLVSMPDSFPEPNTRDEELNRLYAIRRECRGIKFGPDGRLLARPYHKFFNLDEKPETLHDNVDFGRLYVILNKMDGSMIHPIFMPDGDIAFCTRMGVTDVAIPSLVFARNHNAIRYMDFCNDVMKKGQTPIFEWCSNQQRIVINYPDDMLILTAIRDNLTGKYLSVAEMEFAANSYNVPIVGQWQGTYNNVKHFVEMAQQNEGEEGYVIRFADGHMLKVKNFWYVQLHKTKELLTFEKDVWALVLNDGHDDAKAFMEQEDKDRIDAFASELNTRIKAKADELNWVVVAARDNLNNSKKRFALEIANNYPDPEKGILFKIWDGIDPVKLVREAALKMTSSGPKLDSGRKFLGDLRWEDF